MDPKQIWCVGGWHKSNIIDIIEYQNLNPIMQTFVKVRTGKIDTFRRSKG